MTTIDQLPIFENFDSEPRLILSGITSSVYLVNRKEQLVAKVFDKCFEAKASDEFAVAQALYAAKVSVPKPESLSRLTLPQSEDLRVAFIMQYIDGCRVDFLNGKERWRAQGLYDQEIKRVKELGFMMVDVGSWNALYVQAPHEKIYLIDFAGWKLPGSPSTSSEQGRVVPGNRKLKMLVQR